MHARLAALYLTWKCREGCYGERAHSVRNREASVSVETPVNCAEAGVGTAVLLWAQQQASGESRAAVGTQESDVQGTTQGNEHFWKLI